VYSRESAREAIGREDDEGGKRHNKAMAIVHMSEAEVARDLNAVLAKVQQGVEIVIEQDHRPVAVLKAPQPEGPGRKLSECIALAKAYEEKLGYAPIPDADFAKDVEAGIDARRDPFEPHQAQNRL
jgi:antitoxin (DNA-binding transcriptional repressor) of toxin-antitoxin stability system